MEEDPYNNLGNVRARTANEILKAFGHLARHERELCLPIYAHHGTNDRLANLQARQLLSARCFPLRVFRCVEALRHIMKLSVDESWLLRCVSTSFDILTWDLALLCLC
jgi:hypothetical protein